MHSWYFSFHTYHITFILAWYPRKIIEEDNINRSVGEWEGSSLFLLLFSTVIDGISREVDVVVSRKAAKKLHWQISEQGTTACFWLTQHTKILFSTLLLFRCLLLYPYTFYILVMNLGPVSVILYLNEIETTIEYTVLKSHNVVPCILWIQLWRKSMLVFLLQFQFPSIFYNSN